MIYSSRCIPFSKHTTNYFYFKGVSFLKRIACLVIALCLTSALFSQVAPWPTPTDCTDVSMTDVDGTNCQAPMCPPPSNADARRYRGTRLVAPAGCVISTTPPPTIPEPTLTCPVKSITYSIIEPTTSAAYLQYCSFSPPVGEPYQAQSQGWVNQLFCNTDAFGLPAPPAGITFVEKLNGEVASLPGRENDVIRDLENAQLIQLDFWLLLPPTISTVGIQIGDVSADATTLLLGPNLSNMCPVAEFIETNRDGNNWVGYGDRTGYYTIPTTGVSQTCNANVLRARLYITDLFSAWNSSPLIDIGTGDGFVNLTDLPVIAATSGNDNTIPTPVLKEIGQGYVDVNGNVFDINGNWIPVGCKTPGTEEEDLVVIGGTIICEGDSPQDYIITGPPGGMVTYNIDGGPNITTTLNASGTITAPAPTSFMSVFNLISVDFENTNCALSSSTTITVLPDPTASVMGGTFCAGAANFTISGTPNTIVIYNIDNGPNTTITLDAMGNATVPASAASTLNLVSVAYSGPAACSQPLTGSAAVSINAIPIASVTGGTFCGGTGNFSLSGTPNTIVSYNIGGGATTTITLDAMGNASVPATASSTLNLVSVGYSGTLDCSESLSGSVEIIIFDAIPTPTVTGGTFCAGTTASFSLSGTPNTIVNYNINGGTTTSITLDAMGNATVPAAASSTLNLVSTNYSGTTDCSPTIIGGSAVVSILDAIPTPSVTGGTFCGATSANFSISGTPNTIVNYNIDGGTTTSVILNATGNATVATATSSTLNLVSVAYSGTTNCSQSIIGSVTITIDGPTCVTTAPSVYTWSFLDPCNCTNPNNITLADGTFIFADFIRVDASQYTNPMVSLASADANFLDSSGIPIDASTATFINQGGGIFTLPFYTRSNVPGSFTIDLNGDQQSGTSGTCSPCIDAIPAIPTIPTLTQWGLLLYGLLILNLFVGVLYRKEIVRE